MKIVVGAGRCQGHARCSAVAPDLFELDEDGYLAVSQVEVPEGREQLAELGAAACPERAIELVDPQ